MPRVKQTARKCTGGKVPRKHLAAKNARNSVSSGTTAGKATTPLAQGEPQVITDDLLAEAFAFAKAVSKPPPKKPQDAAAKGLP